MRRLSRPSLLVSAWLLLVACGVPAAQQTGRQNGPPLPPAASTCVEGSPAGDRAWTCHGLRVDVRVPSSCLQKSCGLILELHGDTGTGLLEDAHTRLRDFGERDGYLVVTPTGPPIGGDAGATWSSANDGALVQIVQEFARAYRVDAKRIHVTGFSRGGFVTWRLACDHADLFASAAPAGASNGSDRRERTCFDGGRVPSRKIPLLMLIGRTDQAVFFPLIQAIRDAAISAYGAREQPPLGGDARYSHRRWIGTDGALIETFEHSYETVRGGPWGFARGHCFPGSQVDPMARQYALACAGPNAFNWGEEVMRFFRAHPME